LKSKIRDTVKKAEGWLDKGVRPQDVVVLMVGLAEWAYELGRTEVYREQLREYEGGDTGDE
jgi:hypothetical protein